MNIFRLLFELFVVYIVYKLIFDFIIPVYKTSKQVRQKMNDVHERMQQQQQQRPPVDDRLTSASQEKQRSRPPQEDYIDYEEIK